MKTDLFPETLRITTDHGHAATDSIQVSEHFHKRHDNVLRAIANLECSDRFRRLNFEVATYIDAQGKPRQMVRMTKAVSPPGFFGHIGRHH